MIRECTNTNMQKKQTTVLDVSIQVINFNSERSGSMVECLTRDRGAAGSDLTGFTALWPLSKTDLS